jgi:hypothetical protein
MKFKHIDIITKEDIDAIYKADAKVSLFDHLGYPAGTQLGRDVYNAAKKEKEPVNFRVVETKKYNGKVMLYRKEFLIEYFTNV